MLWRHSGLYNASPINYVFGRFHAKPRIDALHYNSHLLFTSYLVVFSRRSNDSIWLLAEIRQNIILCRSGFQFVIHTHTHTHIYIQIHTLSIWLYAVLPISDSIIKSMLCLLYDTISDWQLSDLESCLWYWWIIKPEEYFLHKTFILTWYILH